MNTRNIIILLVILIAVGGLYYFLSRPEPPPLKEETIYVWLIDMDEITHIVIELPDEGLKQSFIKIPQGDQFPWFFDDAENSDVDTARWGGGIPLLLSGPSVARIIAEGATEEQLATFGLTEPSMRITLTLADGKVMNIEVGDKTPDGNNFYVKAPNRNDIATVDVLWYDVMERIVKEPPYAPPPEE